MGVTIHPGGNVAPPEPEPEPLGTAAALLPAVVPLPATFPPFVTKVGLTNLILTSVVSLLKQTNRPLRTFFHDQIRTVPSS